MYEWLGWDGCVFFLYLTLLLPSLLAASFSYSVYIYPLRYTSFWSSVGLGSGFFYLMIRDGYEFSAQHSTAQQSTEQQWQRETGVCWLRAFIFFNFYFIHILQFFSLLGFFFFVVRPRRLMLFFREWEVLWVDLVRRFLFLFLIHIPPRLSWLSVLFFASFSFVLLGVEVERDMGLMIGDGEKRYIDV